MGLQLSEQPPRGAVCLMQTVDEGCRWEGFNLHRLGDGASPKPLGGSAGSSVVVAIPITDTSVLKGSRCPDALTAMLSWRGEPTGPASPG